MSRLIGRLERLSRRGSPQCGRSTTASECGRPNRHRAWRTRRTRSDARSGHLGEPGSRCTSGRFVEPGPCPEASAIAAVALARAEAGVAGELGGEHVFEPVARERGTGSRGGMPIDICAAAGAMGSAWVIPGGAPPPLAGDRPRTPSDAFSGVLLCPLRPAHWGTKSTTWLWAPGVDAAATVDYCDSFEHFVPAIGPLRYAATNDRRRAKAEAAPRTVDGSSRRTPRLVCA